MVTPCLRLRQVIATRHTLRAPACRRRRSAGCGRGSRSAAGRAGPARGGAVRRPSWRCRSARRRRRSARSVAARRPAGRPARGRRRPVRRRGAVQDERPGRRPRRLQELAPLHRWPLLLAPGPYARRPSGASRVEATCAPYAAWPARWPTLRPRPGVSRGSNARPTAPAPRRPARAAAEPPDQRGPASRTGLTCSWPPPPHTRASGHACSSGTRPTCYRA
jgi:hypothetical protein